MPKKIFFLLLMFACLIIPARADLAVSLINEYHTQEELGVSVFMRGNIGELAPVLSDPKNMILVWQVPFDSYDARCTQPIIDWVRQGHSFWYYDSRYASLFGMKAFALNSSQFKGKPEDGDLGEVKCQGMACAVMAMGSHPIITGVGQATVFLPKIGEDVYSAVSVENDTVALLQFALDSPAVAAFRREGRGLIVFKPLLWVKCLSGERFQMNLLEFSGGYGVPGPGGEGRIGELIGPKADYVTAAPAAVGKPEAAQTNAVEPKQTIEADGNSVPHTSFDNNQRVYAQSLALPQTATQNTDEASKDSQSEPKAQTRRQSQDKAKAQRAQQAREEAKQQAEAKSCDSVHLTGGEVVVGKVVNEEIIFETGTSSLKLKTDNISNIVLGQHGMLDHILLVNGEEHSGFWIVDKLRVDTEEGEKSFSKREILRMEIGAVGAPQ